MLLSQYARKNFIKLETVAKGPIRGTIESIEEGKYGKPVVDLGKKGKLSLSPTNVLRLMEEFNVEDGRDLIGIEIECYHGILKTKDGEKEAVLVRRPTNDDPDDGIGF